MHFGKRGGLDGHSMPSPPTSPKAVSINKQPLRPLHFPHSPEIKREKRESKTMVDKRGTTMEIMGSAAIRDDGEEAGSGGTTGMRTAETLLRLLPMGLCIVALLVMLKNVQTNEFGSLSYSNLGAFRYLVHANGVCAGYSLLTAVVAAMPRPSTMSRAWTFFLLDQFLTYIILAAGAVSTEVVYLAYKGDEAVTWSEACGTFGGFCRRAVASIAITFAVVLCYAALSLISSYRLFSKYVAPPVHAHSSTKGIENDAVFHT